MKLIALTALIGLTACAADKQMHVAAGFVGSGIAYATTGDTKAAWATAAAMGAAKEAYDSTGRGHVEAADFAATVAGAAIWQAVDCLRFGCSVGPVEIPAAYADHPAFDPDYEIAFGGLGKGALK